MTERTTVPIAVHLWLERVSRMKQIITKGKRIVCVTTAPYPAAVVKDMKKAGYKVTEVSDGA